MVRISLARSSYRLGGFDEWRNLARRLLAAEVSPEEVAFFDPEPRQQVIDFDEDETQVDDRPREFLGLRQYAVPKAFLSLARTVALHRDATRWAQLYRLLWRQTHGEPRLLAMAIDDDVLRARRMELQVSRDAQKLKTAVRFRQVEGDGEPWCVAWHRPEHRIVRWVAAHFAERFAAMKWTILTPDVSASWDGARLIFHAGTGRRAVPSPSRLERIWRAEYETAICPARRVGSAVVADWKLTRELVGCAAG